PRAQRGDPGRAGLPPCALGRPGERSGQGRARPGAAARRGRPMKLRIAAIAFLLALLATGITWLSFQPVMFPLVEALGGAGAAGAAWRRVRERAQESLPLYLGLALLIVVLVAFGILYFTVARPLGAVEREMQGLERMDWAPEEKGGGPLLSRFQASL